MAFFGDWAMIAFPSPSILPPPPGGSKDRVALELNSRAPSRSKPRRSRCMRACTAAAASIDPAWLVFGSEGSNKPSGSISVDARRGVTQSFEDAAAASDVGEAAEGDDAAVMSICTDFKLNRSRFEGEGCSKEAVVAWPTPLHSEGALASLSDREVSPASMCVDATLLDSAPSTIDSTEGVRVAGGERTKPGVAACVSGGLSNVSELPVIPNCRLLSSHSPYCPPDPITKSEPSVRMNCPFALVQRNAFKATTPWLPLLGDGEDSWRSGRAGSSILSRAHKKVSPTP
mmetsp:Transcript_27723/g.48480  ORF Transcript_27723/g.48480 Transcript_27723/m.48480 type:complete len:287 (+) Transcript_27723:378-1238(+)